MIKKTKKITISVLLIISFIILILFIRPIFEKPRFTPGLIDDPTTGLNEQIKERVLYGGSETEVILIHGLGATAWETKELAEYLNSKNITTHQVLLAGHGKSIYELESSTSQDWYQNVETVYDHLNKPKKFIIGVSNGGLLALDLSEKKELSGIILLSTPITFVNSQLEKIPLLKYFYRFYYRDLIPEHKQFYHENFPYNSLAELVDYIQKIKTIILKINTPALIIQSKNDPTVDPNSAQYIYYHINSEKKEIVWLNNKEHVLIIDYPNESEELVKERQLVFKKIYNFILENS